jgi:hypothetical protein
MPGRSLADDELSAFLRRCPPELCDLILELRDLVRDAAPQAHEKIAFSGLCYFKPNQPYGVIGGNICLIGVRGDAVLLGFIHGAGLPDPDGLLQGAGKAKRHIEIRTPRDIRRRAFKRLLRAAVDYTPDAVPTRRSGGRLARRRSANG